MAHPPLHPQNERPPSVLTAGRTRDWPEYFRAMAGRPPRETLLEALDLHGPADPGDPPLAIDLGCGEGRDTAELLARGWRVLALDGHPEALLHLDRRTDADIAQAKRDGRLETRLALFEDLHELPEAALVNASFTLPFCPPEHFARVWGLVRAALRPGGFFAGQLFGDRDTWAAIPDRTHHTRGQALALLDGLTLHRFQEEEKDGEDCAGTKKHWHCFHVVAQRPHERA